MKPEKGQKFYDESGLEIGEGDLLKVYHFRAALRRQKHYMYKIATIVDGYMYGKDIRCEHKVGLWSICDNYGLINGTTIIDKVDWENEGELRRQARKRIKQHLPF